MEAKEQRPVLDLTVFILSYNRPQYLREMLLSVLAQTASPEEIIILDNGSESDTRQAVNDLLGESIKWIGAEYNHQSAWNFTRACGMSEKKYFTILHDDDHILPEFLKTTVGMLEENEKLIAITTNGYIINEKGSRTGLKIIPDEPSRLQYYDQINLAIRSLNIGVPFSNVVYRNGYPDKIFIKQEFGKLSDGIYLIDLAGFGDFGVLNDLLIEYRIHSGSDSSGGTESVFFYRKEEYTLSLIEKSNRCPYYKKQIIKRRTRRLGIQLLTAVIRKKEIGSLIGILSKQNRNEICISYLILYLLLYIFIHNINIMKYKI